MPEYNAEAADKALAKQLDKLESTLGSRLDKLELHLTNVEKSVKVLLETRGDSKADALKKIEAAMGEQSKALSVVDAAQKKAFDLALKAGQDQLHKVSQEERKAAAQELAKTEQALRKDLDQRLADISASTRETDERIKTVRQQAEALAQKRQLEVAAQHKALGDKLAEQMRAQALLENRLIALQQQVQTAMALASAGRK